MFIPGHQGTVGKVCGHMNCLARRARKPQAKRPGPKSEALSMLRAKTSLKAKTTKRRSELRTIFLGSNMQHPSPA